MIKTLGAVASATAAYVDEDHGVIWYSQADGTVGRMPLAGGKVRTRRIKNPAVGIAGNGRSAVFAHDNGTISVLNLDHPDAPLKLVQKSTNRYGQIGLTPASSPTAFVVTHGGRKRSPKFAATPLLKRSDDALTLVKVKTKAASLVDIHGLTGVAVGKGTAFVARNHGSPARGALGVVRGSVVKNVATGLPRVGRLGLAEGGDVVLVAHPGNRLSAVRPAKGSVETVSTASLGGQLVEAHGLVDGRILILTTDILAIIDALADLTGDPTIDPPGDPIFVGSWVELGFDLGSTGLAPDAVHFEVPDGPEAGFVSYTRPDDFSDPVAFLVVGGRVGAHDVAMVETATGTVLASTTFEIADHWTDADTGPGGFYTTDSSFDGDSGWGGGPGAPQNLGVHPHNGTWRSMVLMVDTTTGRWPTAAATMTANRTAILNHVTNGIMFNGDTRSARLYYEENSHYTPGVGGAADRGLTLGVLSAQTFGPVNMPGSWTDYFAQTTDAAGTVIDDRWTSMGGTLQTIITRAIADGVATTANFTNLDVLIVVPRSPDATGAPPARFVWPHANDAREFLCGTNATTDRRSFGYTFVPLDFAAHDGRQMHSTLSHELGHTLSLPDLYNFPAYSADVSGRLTSNWDMMAGSRDTLPHYTVSNKMRMAWIQAGHIKRYDFQGSGAITDTVTLHAAELGDPPTGEFAALEIRLGDGWNYYVEYRSEQAAQISDDTPTDRRIVITDVTSDTFAAPIARPPILLVRNDIDGDGPILGPGTDLEEKDPGTQMDLKVDVVSVAGNSAVVKLTYGANGKPEPGIRPWNDGPDWQSPDIEVRNDRATADPGHYFNMPWLGHPNTVVAKIRNNGDLLAKGVVVDFFVTEYTAGDGPWVPLGSDTRDVGPGGGVVEFTAPWSPSAATGKHYCVIVRIRLYQDPANLAVVDQNIYNNEARSNYTRFVSASASPSTRVGAEVLLGNPFDESTHVFAVVRKTHPQHRVFVDHQWLRVGANGQRPVRIWDEATWGTPEWGVSAGEGHQKEPSFLWEVPNRVSLSGYAERPFEADCGALTLTGGVGIRVDAGRATRIRPRELKRNFVTGEVAFADDGSPVTTGGVVLIEVIAKSGRSFTDHRRSAARRHVRPRLRQRVRRRDRGHRHPLPRRLFGGSI